MGREQKDSLHVYGGSTFGDRSIRHDALGFRRDFFLRGEVEFEKKI